MDQLNPTLSAGSFKKYKLPVFKRATKRTDICNECAKLPYLEKQLSSDPDNEERKSLEGQISVIKTHKQRAEYQRNQFKEQIEKLKEGEGNNNANLFGRFIDFKLKKELLFQISRRI